MKNRGPKDDNQPNHVARFEHWLRTTGVERYDRYKADPSRLLSAEETWNELQRHMKARSDSRDPRKSV
jgi:hypothetical protein